MRATEIICAGLMGFTGHHLYKTYVLNGTEPTVMEAIGVGVCAGILTLVLKVLFDGLSE